MEKKEMVAELAIKQENTKEYRKALAKALKAKLIELGGKGISVKTNDDYYYISVRGSRTSDEQPGKYDCTPEQWEAIQKLTTKSERTPVSLWRYRKVEEVLGLTPILPEPDY